MVEVAGPGRGRGAEEDGTTSVLGFWRGSETVGGRRKKNTMRVRERREKNSMGMPSHATGVTYSRLYGSRV